MKKPWTVDKRFPTKRARDLADLATDTLTGEDTMSTYIDVWLAAYLAAGGIEKC